MTLPFAEATALADDARARELELGKAPSIAVVDYGGFVVHDSGSPFKEQGAPGLRFYIRIKTAAVTCQW